MKHLFFTSLIIALSICASMAQTDVTFNINHKLGESAFALNTSNSNNIGHSFKVSRLQYYISEISVVHDSGTETMIDDLYILVDAAESAWTSVSLGNLPVTNVEAVKFHIGVDEANNHANPADWPTDHALAPTSPSMHWGWASGYRFLAYEGKGGNGLDQTFQLHGTGDSNYFTTEIAIDATATNGAVDINLNADYNKGLDGIGLNSGLIVHGSTGAAKTTIENFRDHVFTPSTSSVANVDISEINSFDVFPNPSLNGKANLVLNSSKNLNYEITVVDVLGREVEHFYNVSSNERIELELGSKGLYFVSLIKEGQAVLNRKLLFN